MVALQDIYECKVKYRDSDLRLLENVCFYQYTAVQGLGNPSPSETLARGFNDTIISAWLSTTPPSFSYYAIATRNLFDASDAFELPISRAGTRSNPNSEVNLMPTFVTAKVTLATDNGLVKKGRKMLSGLLEADQATGLLSTIGYANLAIRAATFVLALIDSVVLNVKSFSPVVVKRVRTGTEGNYQYRLPETLGEAIVGNIQSSVLSAILTTQNSRKD